MNQEYEMFVEERSVVAAKYASIIIFFPEIEGKEQSLVNILTNEAKAKLTCAVNHVILLLLIDSLEISFA